MGFRVTGELYDAAYDVEVTGDKAAPIEGSARVLTLLGQWTAGLCACPPPGPVFTVDPADDRSPLALLLTCTRVSRIGEGAPAVGAPRSLYRLS